MHKLSCPQEPIEFTNGVATFRQANPGDPRTPNKQWAAFYNEHPAAYKSAGERLYENQGGLCAYCEIELTDNNRQIEHIIPKQRSSATTDYTFDFDNLLLCCKGGTNINSPFKDQFAPDLAKSDNCSCGEKKGDNPAIKFASPYQLPAIPLVSIYYHPDNGVSFEVDEEACARESIDPAIVDETLRTLGLNCPRLKRNRREIWKALEDEYADLPETDLDKALLELAEAHLTPQDGQLPAYISTRFLFLLADLTDQQLLDITKW